MKAQPTSNFTGSPPESDLDEAKTIYQSRQGVTPTRTTQIAFKDTKEGTERAMDPTDFVMSYTPINSREPTPDEKGRPSDQAAKGAGGVDLRAQQWNRSMR